MKETESKQKDVVTVFRKTSYISAADCNAQQELGVPMLVQKLIDVATEHANILGIGNPFMPEPGMGWVLSRLSIEMKRWPEENSEYTVTTWVEDWNRHFSRRAFSIHDQNGEVLGYARSIWMVLNTTDRSNAGLSGLNFKKEWVSDLPCPIAMQEKHQKIESGPDAPLYRFKYCDIDFYRHVNTVRYVDLLLNQFDMETYDRNYIERFELSFLHEASYGMEIRINSEPSATAPLLFRFSLEDRASGQPILYARLRFATRPGVAEK